MGVLLRRIVHTLAMRAIHSCGTTHHMPGKAPDSDTPSKKRSTKNWTLFFTEARTTQQQQAAAGMAGLVVQQWLRMD